MDTHIDERSTIGTWGWVAIMLGTLVVSVPIDLMISLVFTEMCGQPADADSVLTGRIFMLVVFLAAAIPWVFAVPLSRDSARGAVYALIALAPSALFAIHAFTPGAWTTSFCLA